MDRRLSLLRVIAGFMVVALHVSGEAFHVWGPSWWAGNVYDSLTRACVPLFFMLTGATLLPRQEPLGRFFGRRAVRIVPPLLLWSVFYLWWLDYNGAVTGNWLLAIAAGPTMFHLWFFYALVGMYAIVPVLRRWYAGSTRQDKQYVLALWFLVASVVPTAHTLWVQPHCEGYARYGTLDAVYHLGWFGGYAGYLVLGAYLVEHRPPARVGIALFLAASLATMVGNALLSRHFGQACEFFLVYLTPLVVLASCGLFVAMLGAPQGPPSRALAWLADCSLGVYGLHVFVIDPVFKNHILTVGAGNPWWTVPLVTLGVYAVSLAVISLLRAIPPLRFVV